MKSTMAERGPVGSASKDDPDAAMVPLRGSDPKNIYQRLALAASQVGRVAKEKAKEGGVPYRVLTHDAVTSACRGPLLDAGVLFYVRELTHENNGNRVEVALVVRFQNIDRPEDFLDVPSIGYGVDTQDKGPGKAVSYAVKYALLKTLGLETGDDPENEAREWEPKQAPKGGASATPPAKTGGAEYACNKCGVLSKGKRTMPSKMDTPGIKAGDPIYKCDGCGKWVPAKAPGPVTYADPFADEAPPPHTDDDLPF